jgi:hypothetical protein
VLLRLGCREALTEVVAFHARSLRWPHFPFFSASNAARCVACHGVALTRVSQPSRLSIVDKRSRSVQGFRLLGRGVF